MLKDLKIHKLSGVKDREFDEAIKIYTDAFPKNELRSIQNTARLLSAGDKYQMFVATDDSDRVVGFTLVYVSEQFALLDYMAVHNDFRSRGIGSKMLTHTVQNILSKSRPILLLEIQYIQEPGLKQKADRVRFYKNCGTFMIDDQYLMPGYGNGGEEFMNLMGISFDGSESIVDGLDMTQIVQEIKKNVYECLSEEEI